MRILHKLYFVPAFVLGSLACTHGAYAQNQSVRRITLQEALQAATQNLEIQMARQSLSAAQADVLSANHAPLPVLSSGVSQIDLQNGVGAGSWLSNKRVDKNIGLDWTWERGNKRALRTQAATQMTEASSQDLRETQIQQKLLASAAFFDLYSAQERVGQIQAIATSAQQLAQITQQRLASGDVSAQDATRSQIEAERNKNDLWLAEQERNRAELALRLVLGLSPQGLQADFPKPTSSKTFTLGGALPPIEERADVQAANARVASAQAALQLALALRQNDITVGSTLDHFPGTSGRLLTLRIQVPLQLGAWGGYTYTGEIERAQAQLALAQSLLERTRHVALGDRQRLTQELQVHLARATSYSEGIAPDAKRVAEQAELAYKKGALSLTDLLDARRTWRATALEAIAAQVDFEKTLTAWNLRLDTLK